jgi:hypothetical protein
MSAQPHALHIDIPVKLDDVKAVFSIGSLAFEGDLPASIFHMKLILGDIGDWGAKSEVVAVFHTNAGHVVAIDIKHRQATALADHEADADGVRKYAAQGRRLRSS